MGIFGLMYYAFGCDFRIESSQNGMKWFDCFFSTGHILVRFVCHNLNVCPFHIISLIWWILGGFNKLGVATCSHLKESVKDLSYWIKLVTCESSSIFWTISWLNQLKSESFACELDYTYPDFVFDSVKRTLKSHLAVVVFIAGQPCAWS